MDKELSITRKGFWQPPFYGENSDLTPVTTCFDDIIDWTSATFPTPHSEQKRLQWGILYEKYHNTPYNPDEIDRRVSELMQNDAVTDKRGSFEYILGDAPTSATARCSARRTTGRKETDNKGGRGLPQIITKLLQTGLFLSASLSES